MRFVIPFVGTFKMAVSTAVVFLVLSCAIVHGNEARDAGRPVAGSRIEDRPNVLFIAVDDLNDWVNCLGGRAGVFTPNLDRLAARGVLFTNAHCNAPACNPSRASVMTGISPATSGIHYNRQHWRKSPVLKNAVTIPELFRANGYKTTGGGKIFHALSWIQVSYGADGNDFSIWDEYFPSKARSLPGSAWPEGTRIDEMGTVTWTPLVKGVKAARRPPYFFDWGPTKKNDAVMADCKVVDWAIAELNKKHDKPFFQAVGIFRPHIPWFVPRQYFDLYPMDKIKLPKVRRNWLAHTPPAGDEMTRGRRYWHEWMVENQFWRGAIQAYLASISFVDDQIGRLLDALDKSPYGKNTIVVLWSDHGFHLGEREHWEKFTLWEESTRVALMISAPGVTKAAGRCSGPVSLLDIYPTLIALCHLKESPRLEGQSLVRQLVDPAAPRQKPAVTTWGKSHAVRTGRWRYIRYANGDEELYDHDHDPDEFNNLAALSEYATMKNRLSRWLPASTPPGE